MSSDDAQTVTELTDEEAMELLRTHRFGRLAMSIAGLPEIVPINHCVAGDRIFFRTAAGSKLLGLTINSEIAFEIDQFGAGEAVSVIVKGVARRLETRADIEFAETLPLHPWVDTDKHYFVEIVPQSITGRRFRLNEYASGE